MKRKGIIGPLLIAVLIMAMLSACASSRHVANVSHTETMDSVRSEQVDSSHVKVAASDSVQKSEQSTVQVSSSVWERDSLDEIIREHITETTDAQDQRHEIEQMKQSVDSSALSSKSDVGTHWAAKDTLSDNEEKNTEDVKKKSFGAKARKNAFQLFLLMVVFILLLTLKRKRDDKLNKDK